MSLSSLLTQRCTIRRPTKVNDAGIITTTYADAATEVRCLVQEKRGQILGKDAGSLLEYDATAFFLPSTDVRPGAASDALPDDIHLTGPSSHSGQKFSVVMVADEAGKFRLKTAYLRRRHEG